MATQDFFRQARDLFDKVIQIPEEDRLSFVQEACGDNQDLQREVLSLLQSDARAGAFLHGSAIASIGGAEEWLGRNIGQYRLESVIAGGGMGVVFRAIQDQPRREVAIKLIRGDAMSARSLQRFELEAEVLGRLDHPGIAQIFEAGTTPASMGQQPYFVMELIDGLTLLAYAETQGLSVGDKLRLMIRICDAVDHAHKKGVIHRDLKPANILIREDGQPKILDFGVARITKNDLNTTTTFHTDAGKVIGTLPYMSPEQVGGRPQDLDIRSDVYALGVLCYELLTGRLPQELQGKTLVEAARIIQEDHPSTLGHGKGEYPADLETIVRKCLEKDKENRYGSAREFAADLARFLANRPIEARPPSAAYQLKKFARRNRSLMATGVLAFTILIVGLTVSIAGWSAASRRGRHLKAEAEKVRLLNSFFTDMLGAPNVYNRGPDVKVVEVLDLAASRLDSLSSEYPSAAAEAHLTLAETYQGLERYPEAELHYRQHVNLLRVQGPPYSDALVTGLCDLAEVLIQEGRPSAADSVMQELRPVVDHPGNAGTRLRVLHAMSHVQSELGNLDESIALARECVAQRRELDGVDAESTLNAMLQLGGQLVYAKRLDEAREVLEACLGLQRAKHDTDGMMSALNNLGYCYTELDRPQDALDVLLEAQELKIDKHGENSVTASIGYHNIAKALERLGRIEESLESHQRAIAISTGLTGDAVRTLVFRGAYGTALITGKRYEDAETELLAAYQGLEEHLGADNFRTRSVATKLVQLYSEWGKEDKARRFRTEGP